MSTFCLLSSSFLAIGGIICFNAVTTFRENCFQNLGQVCLLISSSSCLGTVSFMGWYIWGLSRFHNVVYLALFNR